jgi:hypothetical protein
MMFILFSMDEGWPDLGMSVYKCMCPLEFA